MSIMKYYITMKQNILSGKDLQNLFEKSTHTKKKAWCDLISIIENKHNKMNHILPNSTSIFGEYPRQHPRCISIQLFIVLGISYIRFQTYPTCFIDFQFQSPWVLLCLPRLPPLPWRKFRPSARHCPR